MNKSLKIGFIIDATEEIPSWYFETIANIANEQIHELFFIKRKKTTQKKTPFFYRLFNSFENYWFRTSFDAGALRPVNSINNKIPFLHPEWGKDWMVSAEGYKSLLDKRLDLIYSIDYEEDIEENLSELATYGLWYIRFGQQEEKYQPTGFSEVMSRQITTESSLIAKKQNEVYLLYQGKTKTVRFSVKNNFNSIAWKSSSYLLLRLKELSTTDPIKFLPRFRRFGFSKIPKKHYPNFSIPYLFVKNSIAYFYDRLRLRNRDKRFSLHYAKRDFQIQELPSTQFEHIPLPDKVFQADPFLLEKYGIKYLFCEEFDEQKNKGHISVMTFENHHWSHAQIVLEMPYHLSYPFIIDVEGEYYMIPESSANKTLSLYKAKNFPYEWELVMHLIENEALIDATLHYEKGKWWLFACKALHPFVSTNDQLFIYFSDDLFSNNWTPHPQNPVVTTIENCRPAGKIFRHNDKLYRPAQNNADVQYGYGLKINEIIVLNENEYQEKEVLSIDPEQLGLKACHHIDFIDGMIVIDGIMKESNKE